MQDDNFTQKELNYISQVKRIGREKGDCKELKELSGFKFCVNSKSAIR